jgi:hypothetical protein
MKSTKHQGGRSPLNLQSRKAMRRVKRIMMKKRLDCHTDTSLCLANVRERRTAEYDEEPRSCVKKNDATFTTRKRLGNFMNQKMKLKDDVVMALRRDDEEIERLERKLGLTTHKNAQGDHSCRTNRIKLHKEYAKLEGYGDDFGQFLDSLDGMIGGILDCDDDTSVGGTIDGLTSQNTDGCSISSGAENKNYSDSPKSSGQMEEYEEYDAQETDLDDVLHSMDSQGDDYTYKPLPGMDLYGNTMDSLESNQNLIKKYIPPHLRLAHNKVTGSLVDMDNKSQGDGSLVVGQPSNEVTQTLTVLRRQLNNHLNRLSENNLESVIKAVSSLYSCYPSHDVNTLLFENMEQICVTPHLLMTKLIPVYMACISGIHYFQQNSSVSLNCASYIVERLVLGFMQELTEARKNAAQPVEQKLEDTHQASDTYSKRGPNLILILCYLYNFQCFHCSLLFDIIRYVFYITLQFSIK